MLWLLAPLSAVGVLALGWWFAGGESAGALDRLLDGTVVEHRGSHLGVLWRISDLGSPPALPLGLLALVLLAVLTRLLTEFVLKPLVGRTHDGGLALPSGHTTSIASMAWVFVLVFVAGARQRPWWLRAGLICLAVLAVLGVAGSMVALDRHYATDTMAGALVATAVVGTLALLLDGWVRRRRMAPRPDRV
jgi:membrane-associated phospholipid phosphatase